MDDSGVEDSGGQNLTQKSGFCKPSRRSLDGKRPPKTRRALLERL
jgi:hypothetical protein